MVAKMNVKEAVDVAKRHVAELFAEEGLANLGLEEVEYDDVLDQWRITVGFSRAWDQQGNLASMLAPTKRTYKVVVIDKDGKAISVKNRETANAA
jgi:hypothetical protein